MSNNNQCLVGFIRLTLLQYYGQIIHLIIAVTRFELQELIKDSSLNEQYI